MINNYQKYHRFELTFELVGCHIIQHLLCIHKGQYGFHKVHPNHNALPKKGKKEFVRGADLILINFYLLEILLKQFLYELLIAMPILIF